MKKIAGLFACFISTLPVPVLAQTPAPTPWPEDCKLVQIASFPMTLAGSRIIITGLVNGQEKRFMVDTGGFASALTYSAADALGLKPRPITRARIRDIGGKDAAGYVQAGTFALGTMTARDFDFMLMENDREADGLLAPDLLLQFDVEIDFEGKRLNLFKPHRCTGRAAYWTANYVSLPFDRTDNGHVRVNITLDGKDSTAILDTGAPVSLLGMNAASRLFDLDEKSAGITPAPVLTGGAGGQVASYAYPFKALTMGGVNVANPKIFLSDSKGFAGKDRAQGLIGMNVLRRLHLYFAYKERELYISAAGQH